MSNLYDNIEALCKQKGVNVTVMCRESGASRGSLTDLKSGRKQTLKYETLEKIAKYFNVSVDSLFSGESPAPAGLDESGYDLDAKEKALLSAFNELTEEGKDLSIEYTQMLGTQNKYKKFALPDAESVG